MLATSLFGDVAAVLREHGSATLDEHCCYFRRPDCVLVGGHRDLRSRGITDCPVTAMKVTRCDGRDSTDVRYPPICAPVPVGWLVVRGAPNGHSVRVGEQVGVRQIAGLAPGGGPAHHSIAEYARRRGHDRDRWRDCVGCDRER